MWWATQALIGSRDLGDANVEVASRVITQGNFILKNTSSINDYRVNNKRMNRFMVSKHAQLSDEDLHEPRERRAA